MLEMFGIDYAAAKLCGTSLAPDIVEAILRGDEPNGLSLRKLKDDLPVCWKEQREMWLD